MTALFIAANDLRQRLRDRSIFVYGLLLPFGLTFVFSLLLGPFSGGGSPVTARVGLVDLDGSPVSAGLRTALTGAQEAGAVTWDEVDSEQEARELIGAGELDAVIVVPGGFGAGALAGEPGDLHVIGDSNRRLSGLMATSVADAYISRLRSAAWAAQVVREGGSPLPPQLVFGQAAAADDPVVLVPRETSDRQLDLVTYYAAGMAAFFVFFTVQLGVTGILDEEQDGTLPRLLAAPVSRASLVLGKVLSSFLIGAASMSVLALASSLVMGANWGSPPGAVLLILAIVLAAAGVVTLVAGLARTPQAAGNLQSIVAVTLGALGGSFFQLPDSGGVLGALRRLTPHFWFMEGVSDLAAGAGPLGVGTEVLAMLAFGLVTGAIGWVFLQRRLTR